MVYDAQADSGLIIRLTKIGLKMTDERRLPAARTHLVRPQTPSRICDKVWISH